MDVTPPEAAFFEELVKHKPIRPVLIKQLSLLDSLTLIRLARTSLTLAEFIRDDAIWAPRLKKQYGGYWFDTKPEFPDMYVTSAVYLCFPTLYDAFIYMTSETPHAWKGSNDRIISVQDWDFNIRSDSRDFSLFQKEDLTRILHWWPPQQYVIWTSDIDTRDGEIKDVKDGPHAEEIEGSDGLQYIVQRSYRNHCNLVPRLSFWYKVSYDRENLSVLPTLYKPTRPLQFDATFYFTIHLDGYLKRDFQFSGTEVKPISFKPDVIYDIGATIPKQTHQKFTYVVIPGGRTKIDEDFSACFFIDAIFASEVHAFRITVDAFPDTLALIVLKREYGIIFNIQNDRVLKIESLPPRIHETKPEQFEFNIDSCLTCGEPAKLKCSNCNRASFCSTECGQEAWSNKTHSTVCSILK